MQHAGEVNSKFIKYFKLLESMTSVSLYTSSAVNFELYFFDTCVQLKLKMCWSRQNPLEMKISGDPLLHGKLVRLL